MNAPIHNAKTVTWSRKWKSGVVEASDIQGRIFGQLTCRGVDIDIGFHLRNLESNGITTWRIIKTFYNVKGWCLAPTTDTLKNFPNLKGWTLSVYND